MNGTLTLAVPDAEAFAEDSAVADLLSAAIAHSLNGIDPDMVEIIGVSIAGTAARYSRRLSATAGDVVVDYKVHGLSPEQALSVSASCIDSGMPERMTHEVSREVDQRHLTAYEGVAVRSVDAHIESAEGASLPLAEPVENHGNDNATQQEEPDETSRNSDASPPVAYAFIVVVAVLIGGVFCLAYQSAVFGDTLPRRHTSREATGLEMPPRHPLHEDPFQEGFIDSNPHFEALSFQRASGTISFNAGDPVGDSHAAWSGSARLSG